MLDRPICLTKPLDARPEILVDLRRQAGRGRDRGIRESGLICGFGPFVVAERGKARVVIRK